MTLATIKLRMPRRTPKYNVLRQRLVRFRLKMNIIIIITIVFYSDKLNNNNSCEIIHLQKKRDKTYLDLGRWNIIIRKCFLYDNYFV